MVREFLSRTPRHSRLTPPLTEGPVSQQNGTETKHRTMQKKQNSESSIKKTAVRRQSSTPMTNKPEDQLLEKIASELYQGKEKLLQLEDTRGLCHSVEEGTSNGVATQNGDGSDVISPTSAPWRLNSRNSYEELLTILETPGQEQHHLLSTRPQFPQFRPKLETMAAHSESLPEKPGFLTVRPRPKHPPLSRDLHFNDFSRMNESYGYEGPPSPLTDSFNLLEVEGVGGGGDEGEGAERRGSGNRGPRKWTRKTAIRRQRRKVGGSISEPPPDTSYSYRVSSAR